MGNLNNAFYINTTPGRADMFSPPDPVEDYRAWFVERYQKSLGKTPHDQYGIAQKVTSIMNQTKISKTKIDIITLGPHAGAAAEALIEISNGLLQVDVIG